MKIEIDQTGCLHIERAGQMKAQRCSRRNDWFCGDECPLFGDVAMEPERDEDGQVRRYTQVLPICGHILEGQITDKRN